MKIQLIRFIFILFTFCTIFSCRSTKKIPYFIDVLDSNTTSVISLNTSKTIPISLRPKDLLAISIQSSDPALNNLLGTSGINADVTGKPDLNAIDNNFRTFVIDDSGYIEIPLIGKLYISGITLSEAKDLIQNKASYYYKEPIVDIRITNFKVTVLGEVTSPGTYISSSDCLSVLDAIGMAGDLTIYAKRDKILLIRNTVSGKDFIKLNLNSSNLFLSPYYSLQQGDIIYIEPNKSKVVSSDATATRTYSLIASAATVLIVLITRINF